MKHMRSDWQRNKVQAWWEISESNAGKEILTGRHDEWESNWGVVGMREPCSEPDSDQKHPCRPVKMSQHKPATLTAFGVGPFISLRRLLSCHRATHCGSSRLTETLEMINQIAFYSVNWKHQKVRLKSAPINHAKWNKLGPQNKY